MMKKAILALVMLAPDAILHGQTAYSGGSYAQDFNTLITSGTNQSWTNDSTLDGWFLFRQPSPGIAITTYNAGTGSSATGNFYSFGATASTERALGGVGSGGTYFGSPGLGAVAGWIALGLENTTGNTLTSFTLSYSGEQWRDGGPAPAAAQTMALEYGFGATFDTVSTWTAPGASFNFTSPVFTATAAAVDGNTLGKVTGIGGTVNASWNNNDTLWLRWIENNDASNDHGLAVDDLTFSASAIPEPSTASLGLIGLLLLGVLRRPSR